MSNDVVEENAITNCIVQMTRDVWESSGKALLLARVGQELTRQGYDLKAYLKGQKLIDVIKREGCVEVLVSPNDPLIHALVPRGMALEEDLSIYFAKPEVSPDTQTEAGVFSRQEKVRPMEKAYKTEHAPSLLSLLMQALEPSDLKRMTIPLDIVEKLHNKKIR